jgi:hypothetical protein
MKALLEAVWEEEIAKAANVRYSGQEVALSLKGGPVGMGTAPVDLALHTLSVSNNFASRLVEWSAGKAFRPSGPAGRDVLANVFARATQPAQGSYRFTIRFMEPRQKRLFEAVPFNPAEVARTFLDLTRAIAEGDARLVTEIVPKGPYRLALAKLSRNLFPSKATGATLEIRKADDSPLHTVRLTHEHRAAATAVVRTLSPKPPKESAERVVKGVLRALDLNRRWLRIEPPHDQPVKCETRPNLILDDVIGPMVNRRVVARVAERSGGRLVLLDVELE